MMPAENETAEQFEERVRNKRSNVLLRYLSNQLEDDEEGLAFSVIVNNNNRKQVSRVRPKCYFDARRLTPFHSVV